MRISEKQIMQLIDFCHAHLHRLFEEEAPFPVIQGLAGLLAEIVEQQSEELKQLE